MFLASVDYAIKAKNRLCQMQAYGGHCQSFEIKYLYVPTTAAWGLCARNPLSVCYT